jgi:hypothetical protein
MGGCVVNSHYCLVSHVSRASKDIAMTGLARQVLVDYRLTFMGTCRNAHAPGLDLLLGDS